MYTQQFRGNRRNNGYGARGNDSDSDGSVHHPGERTSLIHGQQSDAV